MAVPRSRGRARAADVVETHCDGSPWKTRSRAGSVEAGEQRAGEPGDEEDPAERAAVASAEAMIASFDQKPESGGMPTSASVPIRNDDVRERHAPAQPAHPADVLLAGEVVDDDSGGEEEQRLEERVRDQVEHREAVRAEPRAEEHVADLRHRRVGDHALDVVLHERDEPATSSVTAPRIAARCWMSGAASKTGCVRTIR